MLYTDPYYCNPYISTWPEDDPDNPKMIILYPANKQEDAPVGFNYSGEVPNPISKQMRKPAGFPITLSVFDYPRELNNVKGAELYRVTKRGKKIKVPVHVSTPQNPANGLSQHQDNNLCMIPEGFLEYGTKYNVCIKANVGKEPKTFDWEFTTVEK